MYTFEEFQGELEKIQCQRNLGYNHANVYHNIQRILSKNKIIMYENIKDFVILEDLYEYLLIYIIVEDILFLKYSPTPIGTTWDLEIYKFSKKLPNLNIRDFAQVFNLILTATMHNQFRYYRKETYIRGKKIAEEIYNKIDSSDKKFETLMNIFKEELISCNNAKVSPLSELWWEQYSDCYTQWFPREIYEDVFGLLGEKYDYTTFVELI